jgi:hypothetical protein
MGNAAKVRMQDRARRRDRKQKVHRSGALPFLPEPVKPLRVEEVEEPDALQSHTVGKDAMESSGYIGNELFRVQDGVSSHVPPAGDSSPPTEL